MTEHAMIQADAYPRKRFFLEMFTRDISLEDCLLDLVDNSIDSYIRTSKRDIIGTLLAPPQHVRKESLPEISLTVTEKEVTIADACGGIPIEAALHDVFCFGHAEHRPAGRLGVYGVGLKRAIFKIGNAFEMTSYTASEGFKVSLNVNTWAKSDSALEDWRIPIQPTLAGRSPGGTTIRFTDLRGEVRMRLRDGALKASLQRSVSQAYAFFLERYVRVRINDETIKAMPVPLGESPEISPARSTVKVDGVTMRFFASLIAPKSEWKQERAGWYVLCNGRVVLPADKSDMTGWGGLKLPAFHSKFTGFIGIALLESSDPLKLPWTTTKRGLNRESPIYQAALREIVSISKPILAFLSRMYSSEPEENKVEREVAERVQAASLTALASRGDAAFVTKPKKAGRPTVRVQYDAEKGELDRVRRHLRNPQLGANHIGRLTLDYYLRVECSE